MRRDHLEPLAEIEGAKKGMRHVIFSQVFVLSLFLHENPCLLANFVKLREHFVLLAEQSGVEWNRRLARNDGGFDQRHRKVEAFQKRPPLRRTLQNFARILDDGALDLNEVADKFGSGPAAFGVAGLPLIGGNGLGGSEELGFGAGEIFDDGLERGHETIL